jgi:hypothetical protein
MHRPWSAAVLVAGCLTLCSAAWAAAPAALQQARALLARNDGAGAAALLEEALSEASETDRRAIVDALRTAYDLAAKQAETAGQKSAAETYRDNLAILNRKPVPRSSGAAEAPAPLAAIAPLTAPAPLANPPSTAPASVSDLSNQPLRRPETGQAALGGEAPPQRSEGSSQALDPAAALPLAAANEPPRAGGAAVPSAPLVPSLPAADAAFRLQHYDEAGRIYGALAQVNKLPLSRRDHWAYCRCAEVVTLINANPRTPREWAAIQLEVDKIRALSPNNWFGEYLHSLAAERSAAALRGNPPAPAQQPKVTVRGSAPEEPVRPTTQPPPSRPSAPAAPPSAALPSQAPRAPVPAGTAGNWQVLATASFRILHADPALADRVARVAEAARDEQCRRWLGESARGAWSPKCDIYIYPNKALFSRMTGQPEDSPGFSTMGLNGGRIVARRVNLRADHPNLLASVLPHEVTHVVLADLFPDQPIPRWADEGMAVLAEPVSEQGLRAADLADPLAAGRLFRVQDLMAMDYPDGKYWGLYYAQSVSVTRYLVELDSPARFIQFLQASQDGGVEVQLRKHYQIDGFADLQRRWHTYARASSTTATAAARGGASPAGERRRE